jgi:hypothetical protein
MENSPNSTCPVLAFFCLILTNETPMMGYVIAAVQITFPFAIRAASSGNIQELMLLPSLPGDFFILFSGTVGGKDMAPVSHRGLNCFHIYYAERGLVCERERERERRGRRRERLCGPTAEAAAKQVFSFLLFKRRRRRLRARQRRRRQQELCRPFFLIQQHGDGSGGYRPQLQRLTHQTAAEAVSKQFPRCRQVLRLIS